MEALYQIKGDAFVEAPAVEARRACELWSHAKKGTQAAS